MTAVMSIRKMTGKLKKKLKKQKQKKIALWWKENLHFNKLDAALSTSMEWTEALIYKYRVFFMKVKVIFKDSRCYFLQVTNSCIFTYSLEKDKKPSLMLVISITLQ